MYRYCRDNDLRAAEVITDPKGDRKRRAHEQDDPDLYVRIVDRNKDGIVVRGAKLHITAASLIHELVVMPTKGMRQDETDYAVSFSIPVSDQGREDHQPQLRAGRAQRRSTIPRARIHSMPEGFVVFDDVFVPWDRVFLAGEVQLASQARPVARPVGAHRRRRRGGAHVANCSSASAQLVTEMQGKDERSDGAGLHRRAHHLCGDAADGARLCLPPLRDDAVRHDLSQHARDQRRQILLRRELSTRPCATCTISAAAWC